MSHVLITRTTIANQADHNTSLMQSHPSQQRLQMACPKNLRLSECDSISVPNESKSQSLMYNLNLKQQNNRTLPYTYRDYQSAR